LHQALYAAFDIYPSAKGAATHIHHMAKTLFEVYGNGLLHVLGDHDLPYYQREDNVEIVRFQGLEPNLLKRTMAYSRHLSGVVERLAGDLKICHFRDPWSGIPILHRSRRATINIYEINGLPSIELAQTYPAIGDQTVKKIRKLEQYCWQQADHVITPSQSLKDNLIALGLDGDKCTVIYNGAEAQTQQPRPSDAPESYLIYIGAVQPWQGLEVLIKAMHLLKDMERLHLVICCSSKVNRTKAFRKLIQKYQLEHRIHWKYRLKKTELAPWLQHATLSVAPLTPCPRNLQQGCCPLKIIESMAAGVAVVASDLPSVRELIVDQQTGVLVEPDRPSALARRIRVLLEFPDKIAEIATAARRHFLQHLTWSHQTNQLARLYQSLNTSLT